MFRGELKKGGYDNDLIFFLLVFINNHWRGLCLVSNSCKKLARTSMI